MSAKTRSPIVVSLHYHYHYSWLVLLTGKTNYLRCSPIIFQLYIRRKSNWHLLFLITCSPCHKVAWDQSMVAWDSWHRAHVWNRGKPKTPPRIPQWSAATLSLHQSLGAIFCSIPSDIISTWWTKPSLVCDFLFWQFPYTWSDFFSWWSIDLMYCSFIDIPILIPLLLGITETFACSCSVN